MVLRISTDDVGFSAPSAFAGVITTSALDRIANAGLRYTQFHSSALCAGEAGLARLEAFVVQLSRETRTQTGTVSGRVEHMTSGGRARLASTEELLGVLTKMLRQRTDRASRLASGSRWSFRRRGRPPRYLATGTYAFVGGATAEMKILDSVSHQVLAAAVDKRVGGGSVTTAAQWQWAMPRTR